MMISKTVQEFGLTNKDTHTHTHTPTNKHYWSLKTIPPSLAARPGAC